MPHASDLGRLRLNVGEGVTGWVAEHKPAVVLSSNAPLDARFKHAQQLIEDTYQALLSVPLVSSATYRHCQCAPPRRAPVYTARDRTGDVHWRADGNALATSLLEEENEKLVEEAREIRNQLEARKVIERAKGILQRTEHITKKRPT